MDKFLLKSASQECDLVWPCWLCELKLNSLSQSNCKKKPKTISWQHTFLILFLLDVGLSSVLQRVDVLRVWLEDFPTHWDSSACLLSLVKTQKTTRCIDVLLNKIKVRSDASHGSSKRSYLCQSVADPLLCKKSEVAHVGLSLHHCLILAYCVFIPKRAGGREVLSNHMDHYAHKHHAVLVILPFLVLWIWYLMYCMSTLMQHPFTPTQDLHAFL